MHHMADSRMLRDETYHVHILLVSLDLSSAICFCRFTSVAAHHHPLASFSDPNVKSDRTQTHNSKESVPWIQQDAQRLQRGSFCPFLASVQSEHFTLMNCCLELHVGVSCLEIPTR